LDCSSILKMEATCSSETSVGFQQTTRRCIPDGRILQDKYNISFKSLIKPSILID
jgi:hypothetical protein